MSREAELLRRYINGAEVHPNERKKVDDLALIGILEKGLNLERKVTRAKVNKVYKYSIMGKKKRIGNILVSIGKWFLHKV
jgi:hypothetical protein